jgi:signal peptidase I
MGNGGSRAILYGGVLLAGMAYLAQPMRIGVVRGESMEPTLRNGQPYVLNTHAYKATSPQRGEVVVFRHENVTYIKRVAAVGGDSLLLERIRGAQEDELVARSEVSRLRRLAANPLMPGLVRLRSITIPADSVYVVGDCAQLSQDSRNFGPIPVSSILGQVSAPPAPITRPLAADFRPSTTL